ncbi:MAG: M1 family metallopeptidase [Aquihabitans sp.]
MPGHGNPGYSVDRYDLDLDYRVATNALAGVATIAATVHADQGPLKSLTLDLVGLEVQKVLVDGVAPTRFRSSTGKLRITPAHPLAPGTAFTIDVTYRGAPRPLTGRWGEVGWEELADGVLVAGEPDGAPTWFPCNDHPSDKAPYQIAVTTESPYTVVANGSLTERRVGASRTRWVYEQVEPMATYLATVQIGQYELLDVAGSPVPQRAAVPASLGPRFHTDFERQPQMIELFERCFGPYPFASYTVVVTEDDLEIPLEAQGLSIFGANHVDGHRSEERMVAHELAHQWFGNSLTPRRWRDVWLNEGFACYAEWLWSEAGGGPSADAMARRWWKKLHDLPQDLVISEPGPDRLFDDRLYKRGALTLHALRLTVGDPAFFTLMQRWTSENRHGSVTTEDFVAIAGEKPLLETWLRHSSLPNLPDPPPEVPGPGLRR